MPSAQPLAAAQKSRISIRRKIGKLRPKAEAMMDQSGLTLREKQARRVKRGSVFDQSVFRLWPNCEAKLQSQATEQCVCSFSSSDHRTLLVDGFRTSPDFRL